MRQSRAKRLRAEQRDQEPESQAVKWWENSEIMPFLIGIIIFGMVFYVFFIKPGWIASAVDFIIRLHDGYYRWVN